MPAGGVIILELLSDQALNQVTVGLVDPHLAIVRMRGHEGVEDRIGFETDLPGFLRLVEHHGDFNEQRLRHRQQKLPVHHRITEGDERLEDGQRCGQF